jgi:chlorite dismutase
VKGPEAFEAERKKCKVCRQAERTARYQSDPVERARRLASRAKFVANNKERAKAIDAKSYVKRQAKILADKAVYHAANYELKIKPYKAVYKAIPEVAARQQAYMSVYSKRHYEANKGRYLANFLKRREQKRRALPAWADLKAIEAIYAQARKLRDETGLEYEVDHIIPLQGETVSGLHVHTNLRIILRKENRSKSNRLLEDIV